MFDFDSKKLFNCGWGALFTAATLIIAATFLHDHRFAVTAAVFGVLSLIFAIAGDVAADNEK